MTTDTIQDGSSPESMRASPTPDDIINAFLEQQDDILVYEQSQEYNSIRLDSFPCPSVAEDPESNAYSGARLSPSPGLLAGFQQDSQLPSPPESPSGSPPGSESAPRHRRTSSYPRKTGRNGGVHVKRHTILDGTSSKGHMAHSLMVPRKAEDWEPWKNVIHQLYIVQNHILKDIIVIMENTYHFKAT